MSFCFESPVLSPLLYIFFLFKKNYNIKLKVIVEVKFETVEKC